MKIYDTIIVGAGISGLGCARTLTENGYDDFLVISKDIGGRITTPKTGHNNYGAYYMRSDYKHVKPFMQKSKQIHVYGCCYTTSQRTWTLTQIVLRHPIAFVRLVFLVLCFNVSFQRFKRLAVHMQQTEAMQRCPLLHQLYKTNAYDYFTNHGYGALIDHLFNPISRCTTFLDIREANVSVILGCLLLLIYPTYEFEFMPEKLIAPFFDHMDEDEVTSVDREHDHWKLETASRKTHHAHHVVIATPIHISKRLIDIPEETNTPMSVHMAHVRGKPRKKYQHKQFIVLSNRGDDIYIGKEPNDTYLFYSFSSDYDLSTYFTEYEVIAKKYWHPAVYMGSHLLENDRGNGMYLIGDHNVCGMEDSYIVGMYAANQILGKAKH